MDEAKVKLMACMNWIEFEMRLIFFPIPSHLIIYGSQEVEFHLLWAPQWKSA